MNKNYEEINKRNEYLKSIGFTSNEIDYLIKYTNNKFPHSINNLIEKIKIYQLYGYTLDEIKQIALTNRLAFIRSLEYLKTMLDFYNKIGLNKIVLKDQDSLFLSIDLLYARYQYLASKKIPVINKTTRLFYTNEKFQKIYGISCENLLNTYKYERFLAGKEKLIINDFQEEDFENISMKDLMYKYYDNKDSKTRNDLILKSMPTCKKIVLKYSNENNMEDLLQMAYERMILVIDNYNPYSNNSDIYTYIYNRVKEKIIEESQNKSNEFISLTDNDIYSNIDLEDKISEKLYEEEIIKEILDYLDNNKSYKFINIFKRYFGINCDSLSASELCKEYKVSKQYIHSSIDKVSILLYLYLSDKYNYYPSDRIIKLLEDNNLELHRLIRKNDLKNAKKIKYANNIDYKYYSDCDEISNIHKLKLNKN